MKEYIMKDAVKTILQELPRDHVLKGEYEKVFDVLEIEFEYQKSIGLFDDKPDFGFPSIIDHLDEEDYIINACIKKEIFLTEEDVRDFLSSELIYLEKIGAVSDIKVQELYN